MGPESIGKVKEAMLVTVAENGETEKVLPLQEIQEIEIETEEYTQDL